MEMYLVKSAVILTILYGFYKLVLENESMHIFKRFYLLGSLPAAFLIPLVTFTSYVEAPVSSAPLLVSNYLTMPMPATEVSVNIWPFVLWGMYALGVVFFTIKFGKNLNQLISKIKNNPKFTRDSINHILLKTPVVPHTFLNYVFLNKQKFEANEIPEEVIQHEHVHAKQKHSIDILLVELLQIVFWFNPLLYFIKRSIKLNHEFLADRAVLNKGTNTVVYQKILLAFSSHAGTPTLANSINYSFIKKRFTVMKKQTSTQAIWLRSLLILPLVAILVFGFSSKENVLIEQEEMFSTETNLIQDIKIVIDEIETIFINGKQIALEDISLEINNLNTHLTTEQKHKYLIANIGFEGEVNNALAEKIGQILYSSNIRKWSTSHLKSQRNSNLKPVSNYMVGKTIEEAEIIYQKMMNYSSTNNSNKIKQDNPWAVTFSEPFKIEGSRIEKTQEKATKAEVEEYNKLAKKYNRMSKDNMRIISAEIDRMTVIYNKMTQKQKENGEPFPNFPPPPPAPPAPDAPKVGKKPPLPFLPATPPPAPMSDPIEYIKALHKSGAVFFIGPHQYNYEEVLEMAKKSDDLNIDLSEYPKVNLLGC